MAELKWADSVPDEVRECLDLGKLTVRELTTLQTSGVKLRPNHPVGSIIQRHAALQRLGGMDWDGLKAVKRIASGRLRQIDAALAKGGSLTPHSLCRQHKDRENG